MSENKMKEVAKIFGVDLEEEFKIKYDDKSTYVFKEDGLFEKINGVVYSQCDIDNLLTGESELVKIPKPILDEKEKEYLSNITKPLKKIKYISKNKKFSGDYEYISIVYRDSTGECALIFPDFKAGRMYRGMLTGERYTIQELGL